MKKKNLYRVSVKVFQTSKLKPKSAAKATAEEAEKIYYEYNFNSRTYI